jgi:hypothetical protein
VARSAQISTKTIDGCRIVRYMNAINVIAPYKHHGMWVFDDERVGLKQEPFVAGADAAIDRMVRDIPNAALGFTLVFSAHQFPGHQHQFVWRRHEGSGDVYYSKEFDQEGWLCPALLRYFDTAPEALYIQVKPSSR